MPARIQTQGAVAPGSHSLLKQAATTGPDSTVVVRWPVLNSGNAAGFVDLKIVLTGGLGEFISPAFQVNAAASAEIAFSIVPAWAFSTEYLGAVALRELTGINGAVIRIIDDHSFTVETLSEGEFFSRGTV